MKRTSQGVATSRAGENSTAGSANENRVLRPIVFLPVPIGNRRILGVVKNFFLSVFNILISVLLLIFFSPLMLIVGVAIKLGSTGPVIYKQQRVGLDGRTFLLYKFRTMVRDAEMVGGSLLARNEVDGPCFKMRGDPRITQVGRLLRRFSIDELPQLVNVLKGEMNFVGPRPVLPQEAKQYEEMHKKMLSVKPGIISPWHTCRRRYTVPFGERLRLEAEYVYKRSFCVDLKILCKALINIVREGGW